jgi:hypothetical protein
MDVELLAHPNIPKPLHGMAPRVFLGNAWWQKERNIAIAEGNHRCWACGVHTSDAEFHNWLEVHETYKIDWGQGIAVYDGAVALCHACHMFIHSGRLLAVLQKGEVSWGRVYRIVDRGLDLCFLNGVVPFIGLKPLVEYLGIEWDLFYDVGEQAQWSDWKMVIDGVEYRSKWGTIDDWANHYGAEITEEDRFRYGSFGDE